MNRKTAAFLLLIFLCIFPAACRKETDVSLLFEEDVSLQTESLESAESVETIVLGQPEEEHGSADYDVSAGLGSSGYSDEVVWTDRALYYAEPVNKGSKYFFLIKRTDIETGSTRICCSNPDCSHDSEDCDAYFAGGRIQRYENLLILQNYSSGSDLKLEALPTGFKGHREDFLTIPLEEMRGSLGMDGLYYPAKVILHRGTAVVVMTEQGEFTGSGYEREDDGSEKEPIPGEMTDSVYSFESRYNYRTAVCVYPFGGHNSSEPLAILTRDFSDISNVSAFVLPCGDDIIIVLEASLSEAFITTNSNGGYGGGARNHVCTMEIYRYRIGGKEAELLYSGVSPMDNVLRCSVDDSAIWFLGEPDNGPPDNGADLENILLTLFDLSNKAFSEPVRLFAGQLLSTIPAMGEGYVAAVVSAKTESGSLEEQNDPMADPGASDILICDYKGRELNRFDFDLIAEESEGKPVEVHYIPLIKAAGKDFMVIQAYAPYYSTMKRAILPVWGNEMMMLE